jgi:N6-adenosine-specific RNA methylase IME4
LESAYEPLGVSQLSALPVSQLADEDAWIYMLAYRPLLGDAYELMNAWGFEHRTGLIWQRFCSDGLLRADPILVGTRGAAKAPDLSRFAMIEAAEPKRMQLPQALFELIDNLPQRGSWPAAALWTDEGFAPPGWTTWAPEKLPGGDHHGYPLRPDLEPPVVFTERPPTLAHRAA